MTIAMGTLWILSGVICSFGSTTHVLYMYICINHTSKWVNSKTLVITQSFMHKCNHQVTGLHLCMKL